MRSLIVLVMCTLYKIRARWNEWERERERERERDWCVWFFIWWTTCSMNLSDLFIYLNAVCSTFQSQECRTTTTDELSCNRHFKRTGIYSPGLEYLFSLAARFSNRSHYLQRQYHICRYCKFCYLVWNDSFRFNFLN